MMSDSLSILAAGKGGPCITRKLAVLSRRGQPFLYFPQRRAGATHALSLHPAQRGRARAFHTLLRGLCSAGLVRLLPSATVNIGLDAPLPLFLGSLVQTSGFPDVAVLAGNPNAAGRRFIILTFDSQARPKAVVKAGLEVEARRLIEAELAILESAPSSAKGIPRIRATLKDEGVQAMALDYLNGAPPRMMAASQMAIILGSWIDSQGTVSAREVPCWQRLDQRCSDSDIFQRLRSKVEARRFHPVLHHGDFAPWNVKVSPLNGTWQVLDWERGERVGLPCWDWFHYHIQVGILVDRLAVGTHAGRIEDWLDSEAFLGHAEAAGVSALRRELLLAYLLHVIEVTQPSEGLPATKELLNVLAQRWTSA